MNLTQPIVINFTSQKEIQEQAYRSVIATINDAFMAARGNLEAMEALLQLAKELRYEAEKACDLLYHGPLPRRESPAPDARFEVVS
jgi:hypothetical protein